MADAALDLRQDALTKRVANIGANNIRWSSKDAAHIRDYIMSLPAEIILRDAPRAQRKRVETAVSVTARRNYTQDGIVVRQAKSEDRNFLFIISSTTVDHAGDVINVDGIDSTIFSKNPIVLNSHNSSELPIAVSTVPKVSGQALTAIAKFPPLNVSESSDQVAAAISAGLVKGSSVGFIPLRWSFSKDPSRPLGVDFHETKLLEWSISLAPARLRR